MGSTVRRSRQHCCIRPYLDSFDASEGKGCLRHHPRWREDCIGYSREAAGRGPWTGGVYGYPVEKTRHLNGGGHCSFGGSKSVVQLCQWTDHYGHWWQKYVSSGQENIITFRSPSVAS